MSPCWDCFKTLANCGVVRIVFDVRYTDTALQEAVAARCGIEWVRLGTGVFVPGECS
jgi:deoxycytidylate deaminase